MSKLNIRKINVRKNIIDLLDMLNVLFDDQELSSDQVKSLSEISKETTEHGLLMVVDVLKVNYPDEMSFYQIRRSDARINRFPSAIMDSIETLLSDHPQVTRRYTSKKGSSGGRPTCKYRFYKTQRDDLA